MNLSTIQRILKNLETIAFKLPNGELVPEHFHVTEVGKINKHFIDCGGTVRTENVINFQLWNANDYNHRIHPQKLIDIIQLSIDTLDLPDAEIEVEFQGTTIEKYALDFDGKDFLLVSKHTNCLAPDKCGIPEEQLPKISNTENQCCTPNSGCC